MDQESGGVCEGLNVGASRNSWRFGTDFTERSARGIFADLARVAAGLITNVQSMRHSVRRWSNGRKQRLSSQHPKVTRSCAPNGLQGNILIKGNQRSVVLDRKRKQVEIGDLVMSVDAREIHGGIIA